MSKECLTDQRRCSGSFSLSSFASSSFCPGLDRERFWVFSLEGRYI